MYIGGGRLQVNVKLEVFEGPFDLLYHLIEKNEINIYDIPIAKLTDQYLEYLEKMQQVNMENISEFLVMAATLIEIKSKLLLPKNKAEEKEEIDPREELVKKLVEYKKFKVIAQELDNLQINGLKTLFKEADIKLGDLDEKEDDVSKILNGLSLTDILIAFEGVMKRKEKKVDKVRSGFNSVQKDLYTIEEKSEYLLDLLKLFEKVKFQDIFREDADKMEVVVTFLALLELIKVNEVNIYQDKIFGEIVVEKNHIDVTVTDKERE